jgi:hypothetical protein
MPDERKYLGRVVIGGAALACVVFVSLAAAREATAIPATRLMTVYQFDGPLEIPYYDADRFARRGAVAPAGTLTQGSAVIPCLLVRGGAPLTDDSGTPYVGFEVVVDARRATPDAAPRFTEIARQRKEMRVRNHHCPTGVRNVIDVRKLAAIDKAPRFDPAAATAAPATKPRRGDRDDAVRAFHASPQCALANRDLVGRRDALRRAWDSFIAENQAAWPSGVLDAAKQLDYVMRTAIYEGHLDRGCSAYGACERNTIALSIRNRAIERCQRGQGCGFRGDFQGVAAAVAQYNIWDELLTQVSGLTSCFLRPDLATTESYAKLQARYAQSLPDIERILFGDDSDLRSVFPGGSTAALKKLRHYYHPPAMGQCFPGHPRLEYISGAVARKGNAFALIANTRVRVDAARPGGYLFRKAIIDQQPDRDVVRLSDDYPGFVIDKRKVQLGRPARCAPYGTPAGCKFGAVGRYRRTPSWLSAGNPLRLTCRIQSRGESCTGEPTPEEVRVGGVCDTAMQPIAGVP